MLHFIIDTMFVLFGGWVFQQTIGIPMDTNCALLLADLLLHIYEANFLQGFPKKKERKLAQTFYSSFRYIDGVLSLKNSRVGGYLHRISNQLIMKIRILLILKCLLFTLTFTFKSKTEEDEKQNSSTNAMTSLFH